MKVKSVAQLQFSQLEKNLKHKPYFLLLIVFYRKRRKKANQIFSDRFGFLTKVYSMSDMKHFCEKPDYLVQHYFCDLDVNFTDEFIMFSEILKMDKHQVKTVG